MLRWSVTTGLCSDTPVAPAQIIRSSAWRLQSRCSPIASRPPLVKPASTVDQLPRSVLSTSPVRTIRTSGRCSRSECRRAAGRESSIWTTTHSPCFGPVRRRRTGSVWCAAPVSTASGNPHVEGGSSFQRWAPSLVIGVAAARWGWRLCSSPSGLKTAGARRPCFGRRCRSTFGQPRWPMARIHELAPVMLWAAAAGDRLASAVVARLAQEVFLMVRVAIDRLGIGNESTDVVLGGGVLTARQPQLVDDVSRRIHGHAPGARVQVADSPPVVGAALLGLDALGLTASAEPRVRRGLLDRINGLVVTAN